MVKELTENQIPGYRELFDKVDRNCDHFVSTYEFKRFMKILGQNLEESEIKDFFQEKYADGIVQTEDFYHFVLRIMNRLDTTPIYVGLSKIISSDTDRLILTDELNFLTSLGERLTDEELDERIREANVDENGELNFDLMA
jgi:calmodulin